MEGLETWRQWCNAVVVHSWVPATQVTHGMCRLTQLEKTAPGLCGNMPAPLL